jgi:hypothetical protein
MIKYYQMNFLGAIAAIAPKTSILHHILVVAKG